MPQLADAAQVLARIRQRPGVRYPVLAPNMKVGGWWAAVLVSVVRKADISRRCACPGATSQYAGRWAHAG